jgi:hypothetical protein
MFEVAVEMALQTSYLSWNIFHAFESLKAESSSTPGRVLELCQDMPSTGLNKHWLSISNLNCIVLALGWSQFMAASKNVQQNHSTKLFNNIIQELILATI